MKKFRCSGYASVFDMIDEDNDNIHMGAFKDEIKYMIGLPVLAGHDRMMPIGRLVAAKERIYGLYVTMELFPDIAKASEYIKLVEGGMRMGLSIGYRVLRSETLKNNQVRHLYKLKLLEISMVAVPANSFCLVDKWKGKK